MSKNGFCTHAYLERCLSSLKLDSELRMCTTFHFIPTTKKIKGHLPSSTGVNSTVDLPTTGLSISTSTDDDGPLTSALRVPVEELRRNWY